MTIKKEGEKRWVELAFVLPGSPEQLWHALATGPGMGAWFLPATVDERAGGAITFHFGEGATSSGEVTAWEPPLRFGYEERNWSGEAPPLATEITIEARRGGQCVVRMVHTLFTSRDDWDGEMESFEVGWPGFFRVLEIYLRDFTGQEAAAVRAMAATTGTHQDTWRRIAKAHGVAGADVGERRVAPPGAPPLAGVVEQVHLGPAICEVLLRLEEPHAGVAVVGAHVTGGRGHGALSAFFYGEGAATAAARYEPACQAWVKSALSGG
jgi:uncharacterized protein YndB with AHSA1/START domain